MSGAAPQIQVPKLQDARVVIITASWHQDICNALVAGAQRALQLAEVKDYEVIEVPGSFELPLAAKYAFDSGADAAIVLGVVLRGETPHFDYVCQGVTDGVMQLSLSSGKPIGFGVLTVDSIEQAQARCGIPGSKEDKGFDSAIAALELLRIKRERVIGS